MQSLLGYWLGELGQAIQHIHGFVLPAPLLADQRKHFFQRGPEPHGSVSDSQFWRVHAP